VSPRYCRVTTGADIVLGMERVVGIGGYFFRARDPEALAAWYEANLGITGMASGWSWEQAAGKTVFAPFPADTDYFGRRDQQVMLNFRVVDLDAMLTQLRAAGAEVDDEVAEESYGRFGHAVDPESNRFELWEPGDIPEA
jgi:predicted enzyme related to lactoylglutathione lyase